MIWEFSGDTRGDEAILKQEVRKLKQTVREMIMSIDDIEISKLEEELEQAKMDSDGYKADLEELGRYY